MCGLLGSQIDFLNLNVELNALIGRSTGSMTVVLKHHAGDALLILEPEIVFSSFKHQDFQSYNIDT